MSAWRAAPRRLFWLLAAAIIAALLIGYTLIKARQLSVAFAGWEQQAIGPAPGAAK